MELEGGVGTYITESPLLAGVRWLRIEFNLSVAILNSRL